MPEPEDNPAVSPELAELRKKIDVLDERLVQLINERAAVVVEVGKSKRDGKTPIYAPDRERRVLEQVRRHNKGPLPDRCLEAIWRELMSGSFALERPLRIGYLGPPGSYSHLASTLKFGASVEYDNLADISLIFDAVDRGDTDYGVVPIENSTEGSVTTALDCLLETNARVCAEIMVAIHHNLLANCDPPDIKKVYSHPQALAQCRNWLNAQFPNAEKVATPSTSRAVEIAAQEEGAAAIGSPLAGKLFNVHVQFENVEDNPNNVTRFFVIANQTTGPTGDDKTSLLFTTEHRAGALADVLNVFQAHGLNMTRLAERPSQRVNWEYYFFVDVVGHEQEESVAKAIEAAREHCVQMTVLGSFPRAADVL